ncbi:hypothetical protein IEO21_11096 [Rhodonia placenta]|uniref:Uncharacterized protein n=1 Tax=Rhodonia placenta TaxID=104341 RepID=A0A8H7NRC1_9APHY|nr:hypothetical protein IEO21_11096 [Postia placenta]
MEHSTKTEASRK